MNNYKFRGKTAENKWVYGYFMGKDKILPCEVNLNNDTIFDLVEFVKPETVGQWTGLKDKHGKEIYEGDYLGERKLKSLVVNDLFYDCCDFLYNGFFLKSIKQSYGFTIEFVKINPEYEIIGNIHDNPELLEVK